MSTESGASGGSKHLEFQNTVEGVLLHTLGPDLTPELKSKLQAQGLDLSKPLLPAYPAEDFHRWIRTAAASVWPNATEAEAVRSFGQRSITGLGETLLGKAMKMTLSVLGPRRSLNRATRAFRTNNNYTEVVVKELSPSALELTLNEVYSLPTYYQGVFEGAGVLMSARNYRVSLLAGEGRGARYLVQWDE